MLGQKTLKSKSRINFTHENEETPPVQIGHGIAELVHDMIELIELQFQLLAVDLREGRARAIVLLILGGMAMMLFLGALPVLLFGAGWLLATSTELTMPAAFAIVGVITIIVSAIITVIAYFQMTHVMEIFQRSRRELNSNLNWIKRTLRKLS